MCKYRIAIMDNIDLERLVCYQVNKIGFFLIMENILDEFYIKHLSLRHYAICFSLNFLREYWYCATNIINI